MLYMFSDELKKSTLVEHAELEKKLVARIKKIQDVSGYTNLLKLMYGFYKPLQDRLTTVAGPATTGASFSLRVSDSILQDLADLNAVSTDTIPLCSAIPEIHTPAAAMGAMYVTEGSTLGGQIITKMISGKLKINTDSGFSFFNAYGDDTMARWKNFKDILNQPVNDEHRQQMMEAAKKTFSTFKIWIDDNERN